MGIRHRAVEWDLRVEAPAAGWVNERWIVFGRGQAIERFEMTRKQRAREIAEIQRLLDQVAAAARAQLGEMRWRLDAHQHTSEQPEAMTYDGGRPACRVN